MQDRQPHASEPQYPQPWGVELVRNPSGRAFWFCSRFVSRTCVEYIEGVDGKPRCFRAQRAALAAIEQRRAAEKPA